MAYGPLFPLGDLSTRLCCPPVLKSRSWFSWPGLMVSWPWVSFLQLLLWLVRRVRLTVVGCPVFLLSSSLFCRSSGIHLDRCVTWVSASVAPTSSIAIILTITSRAVGVELLPGEPSYSPLGGFRWVFGVRMSCRCCASRSSPGLRLRLLLCRMGAVLTLSGRGPPVLGFLQFSFRFLRLLVLAVARCVECPVGGDLGVRHRRPFRSIEITRTEVGTYITTI